MSEIIFHIDVNSAYLSWTSVENLKKGTGPDLRTLPAIIGGDEKKRRGVVLAKSTPAKAFGIVTGEPVASALKKCPSLVMALPDHELYRQYSRRLMNLLRTYTSDLEQLSVDECFLYYTPIARRYPSPMAAASTIKDHIFRELGFTVNIGIAPNKLLAKMASDFEKPNRIHTLYMEEIPQKMWPLPVGELYTVGKSSAARLQQLGIHTIGDLASSDPDFLVSHFKSHGRQMWEFANGIDPRPFLFQPEKAKGIGNSTTLSRDASTRKEAFQILLSLAESVSGRLRNAHMMAESICVEIKYHTFDTCSHQMSLPSPANTTDTLYRYACLLFDELWNQRPIRLLGIRTSKLVPDDTPVQMSIFDYQQTLPREAKKTGAASGDPGKQQKLEEALDSIRKRYGKDAVLRGSFLPPPRKP
ncbi:MAG: DNA polymerase Y family protein [Ruminococcus sp.]|jgi:nucleotidyltransferase/DNA polymerase involved in DNA repair